MSETRRITSADGTGLLLRTWEPDAAASAVVVLVHGLGEHTGRYEHVGDHLAGRGWATLGPDLRGFGASEGTRAYVRDLGQYLDDVGAAVEIAAGRGVPVVLLGHSLGGLIALRYAQVRGGVDYLILSAPTLAAEIPWAKRVAARVLSRLAPRFTLPNDITGDQLSRDPAVGEAYFGDPLVETRTTAALGGTMLSSMAPARREGTPVPTLVIHSEDDPLVPVASSAPLGELPGVERVTFPGFRHESFNEEGGAVALATVTTWIDEQLAQAAS